MKKIFFFLNFIVLTILSNAQSPGFQWAKSMGGPGSYNLGKAIVVDSSGNVYTTGNFTGTVDFDPSSGVYNLTADASMGTSYDDVFISKIDSSGNFLWAKRIGGSGYDHSSGMAIDTAGNIYMTGSFQGTVDFDPNGGILNLISGSLGTTGIFVLKLDAFGNMVWAKSMGGSSMANGLSIAVDASENVYTTGGFINTVDFDPGPGVFNMTAYPTSGNSHMFVSKLDILGNFVWAKNIGGTTSVDDIFGGSIAVDPLGNIYTTGTFVYTIDFDPSPGTYNITSDSVAGGSQDFFILKLDNSGNLLWAKGMGGPNFDGGVSLFVDAVSDVCVTGNFTGLVDFDPGAGTVNLNSTTGGGVFILKLSSSGNFVWAKNIQGGVEFLSTDLLDNIYVTGYFNGTGDFDPSPAIYNLTSAGLADVYIVKLNNLGSFVWAKSVGGLINDIGYSSVIDKYSNVYTTGNFLGTADFNPNAEIFNLTAINQDIFIQKLSPNTSVWPGDANHNNIVDNYDLLPIGLFYGQTGFSRAIISNLWQADFSADWGTLESSGADIKHVDCNGDGTIDNNDTLAVNLNFSLTHAFAPINTDERMTAPNLHFVTSSSSYTSGSIVDVEVWAGSSVLPVSNLYGLAFTISYDGAYVQSSSESLTYPASWLGTPGTDAIKIGKIDGIAAKAYGAETRIDHANASGFGKIADFKFQLKSSISSNSVMHFSTSSYSADNSTGTSLVFNTPTDSIIINPTSVGINEINTDAQISVYPNPTTGSFNIFVSQPIKNGSIEVYNNIGVLVYKGAITSQQNNIDLKNNANGIYFVRVMSDGKIIGEQKIVKQ
jgi:hypothetical protein